MKNNNFYKLGVVILLALIAFYSCKKDNMPTTEPTTDNTAYSNMITNRINNFRQQMQNPERSGEMLLDTAVWNLEALINYDYAYPDSASKDFTIMSSHYTVTVDENGMVSEAEVQQVYNLMLDTLNYQLALLNDDVKFTVFSDVQLDEVDGNTARLTVNNGYGSGLILGLYDPFYDDDDWIWGTLGGPLAGKCDGTEVGVSDGSNELQYRLNHPAALPANVGYTDLVLRIGEPTSFPDPNGTGYRIYLDPTATIDNCLYNEDLEYYLIEADDIIKTYEADGGLRPLNKSFVRIEIIDDILLGNGSYCHTYRVTYGTPYDNTQH